MDTTVKTIRKAFETAKETIDIGGREKMLNGAIEAAIKVIEEHDDSGIWREVASIAIAEAPVKGADLKDGDKARKGLAKKDVAKKAAARREEDAAVDRVIRQLKGGGEIAEIVPLEGAALWKETAPRKWIVPDWIPYRVSLFVGQGETGKSRLALQLAVAAACNTEVKPIPWIPGVGEHDVNAFNTDKSDLEAGLPLGTTEPIAVVYATWEDEADESRRRLHPMLPTKDGLTKDLIAQNLKIIHLTGKGPLWQPGGDDPMANRHMSVKGGETPLSQWLLRHCEKHGVKLLILDVVAAAFMGNENDRSLVRDFMGHLDDWAIDTGCAVLLIGHPPKSAGVSYSGSTDWHGACRSMILLEMEETAKSKKETAKAAKDNDPKPPKESAKRLLLDKANYAFRGDQRFLGYDTAQGMAVAMSEQASADANRGKHGDGGGFKHRRNFDG